MHCDQSNSVASYSAICASDSACQRIVGSRRRRYSNAVSSFKLAYAQQTAQSLGVEQPHSVLDALDTRPNRS